MRAIVRSHGHKLWVDQADYSSTRVTWHGFRRDDPDHIQSVTWTIDDAKRAQVKFVGKSGRPSAWTTQPRSMLSARASSELCRLIDEDGLAGISWTSEEFADGVETVEAVAPNGAIPVADEPPPTTPDKPTHTRSTRGRRGATMAPPEASGAAASGQRHDGGSAPPALPDAASSSEVIPVPGDEMFGEGTAAMPDEQRLAMLCREAGIDRAFLCAAVSDGRTTSATKLIVGGADRGARPCSSHPARRAAHPAGPRGPATGGHGPREEGRRQPSARRR